MPIEAIHITENNLSIAWAKAFLASMRHPELSPLTITVTGLDNDDIPEYAPIRSELDDSLNSHSLRSCHTVANTIFPKSLWNPKRGAQLLFDRYNHSCKQIRKCKDNCHGIYFERMISYGIDYGPPTNQLAFIIETYAEKNNHRRSALYASILDPKIDEKHQKQRGFPCLQQVGFVPLQQKYLNVVGFYPKEHIYDRGYGNYLGLCRLGQFMAHEMGLDLYQMTCFVGVASVGKINKTAMRDLENKIRMYVEQYESDMRGQDA